MANVNIRVDENLKKQTEGVLSELGLTLTSATNAFYRQIVLHGGIPFELRLDPFYCAKNQERLRKTISDYNAGIGTPVVTSLADLEKMADE